MRRRRSPGGSARPPRPTRRCRSDDLHVDLQRRSDDGTHRTGHRRNGRPDRLRHPAPPGPAPATEPSGPTTDSVNRNQAARAIGSPVWTGERRHSELSKKPAVGRCDVSGRAHPSPAEGESPSSGGRVERRAPAGRGVRRRRRPTPRRSGPAPRRRRGGQRDAHLRAGSPAAQDGHLQPDRAGRHGSAEHGRGAGQRQVRPTEPQGRCVHERGHDHTHRAREDRPALVDHPPPPPRPRQEYDPSSG